MKLKITPTCFVSYAIHHVRYDGPRPSYRTHTPLVQNYAAKHRLSTRQTSVNHYVFQSSTALYSLMVDCIRSETCRMSKKIFIQRRF